MATMLAQIPFSSRRALNTEFWRRNPPLVALVLAMLVLAAVALLGLLVDPRVITGAPAWMKPLKFAISIAIYGATLLWMLTFIPDRPRLVSMISWGVFLGLGTEMALIVMQVLRSTTSHFNQATPFDAAVFTTMGATISGLWLLNAIVAFLLARRRFAEAPIVWGVRLGLIAALLGMAVAFLMVQLTPEQSSLIAATGSSSVVGAHAVGVADGGPGLPVVGWSTEGGDLRVAHFVGLHGLQVLPLLGLALVRFGPTRLSTRDRSRLVGVAAAFWIAFVLLLVWQALRGQSLIAPDALTLAALGLLIVMTTGATSVVLARAWRAGARASRCRDSFPGLVGPAANPLRHQDVRFAGPIGVGDQPDNLEPQA
jgi:hypothetical protein